MQKFDCNKCMHQNVCKYKDQIPELEHNEESESVFELTLTCKEYREIVTLLRPSEPNAIVRDASQSSQNWEMGQLVKQMTLH